jgi:hypothetical protein
MSTISLRLSNSLHRRVRELAEKEEVSINQLIATAVAEKLSALAAGDYLAERAARGNRRRFDRTLRKVRDVEPAATDRIGLARRAGRGRAARPRRRR